MNCLRAQRSAVAVITSVRRDILADILRHDATLASGEVWADRGHCRVGFDFVRVFANPACHAVFNANDLVLRPVVNSE